MVVAVVATLILKFGPCVTPMSLRELKLNFPISLTGRSVTCSVVFFFSLRPVKKDSPRLKSERVFHTGVFVGLLVVVATVEIFEGSSPSSGEKITWHSYKIII